MTRQSDLCEHGTPERLRCSECDGLIAALRKIEAAARNLIAVKGRHHTEQAYQRLAAVLADPLSEGETK